MDNVIGVKELRENLETYEKLIRKGRSFIVMKRSKPIFIMNPIDNEEWETVIDFTKFKKGGISAQELLNKLKEIS